MPSATEHLLALIQRDREALVRETSDAAYAAGSIKLERESTEQMMRGVIAVVEEAVEGKGTDTRDMFLQTALPGVIAAGKTSWSDMLHDGLPCWGVLIGKLVVAADDEHREEVLQILSRLQGTWWKDVSETVLPLYKERGEL